MDPLNNAGAPAPIAPVQDDAAFFDSVLGNNDVAPAFTAKVDVETRSQVANTPAQSQDDAARTRYEYWQGQADRYRQELEKVSPVATEYSRYAPVIEYLKENPDALDAISSVKAKGSAGNQIQAPSKPVAPSNYNEQDAMTPGTESFRYRMAVDDYRTQLTEYMYAKQELQEKKQVEVAQAEQARQVETQRISQLGNTLVAQYGFSKEQVQDFVQVMNDPSSMEMANLVNLYKVIKHQTKNVAGARREAAPNAFAPPPPPLAGGGSYETPIAEEDAFMSDIASFGKPLNPLQRFPGR